MNQVCSSKNCENDRRPKQRYCRECHASYMVHQRAEGKNKPKELNEEAKRKLRARDKTNTAIRHGLLEKKTVCERCPSTKNIEKHHPDYDKPLEIVWLCSICHGLEHTKDENKPKKLVFDEVPYLEK